MRLCGMAEDPAYAETLAALDAGRPVFTDVA
jgi:hypothetical protein